MTLKSALIAGAMSLSMMATLASAKSYSITLAANTTIGANEVKAGEYEVKLDGNQLIVMNADHEKSITVPATIEHATARYSSTAVEASDSNGKNVLNAIDLGGSDTRVVLGK